MKFAWGNKMMHNSYAWTYAIEHSGEHYGQLVVYYRANNLVPRIRVLGGNSPTFTNRGRRRSSRAIAEQPPPTVAFIVDRQVSAIEKLVWM